MTILAKSRAIRREKWAYKQFTLAAGAVAFKGGIAVYDQSAAVCIPGAAGTDLFPLGLFAEDMDATLAAKLVNVQMKREIDVIWFVNDGTNPVLTTDLGKSVYTVDDQTVSILSTGRTVLGVAWAVDATRGVAVEIT